jgi:hypothetical protein
MLNLQSSRMLRMVFVLTAVFAFSKSVCGYQGEIKPQQKPEPATVSVPLSTTTTKPQQRTTVFSGKIVDEKGDPIPNVTVQVTASGCQSGNCPDDLPCNSKCCDCSVSPCKCCVDQKAETNSQGIYVVSSALWAKYFAVRYSKDGKSEGTFARVEVKPGEKRVTLDVQIQERLGPYD